MVARCRKLCQPIAKNDSSSKKVLLLWANLIRGMFYLGSRQSCEELEGFVIGVAVKKLLKSFEKWIEASRGN